MLVFVSVTGPAAGDASDIYARRLSAPLRLSLAPGSPADPRPAWREPAPNNLTRNRSHQQRQSNPWRR